MKKHARCRRFSKTPANSHVKPQNPENPIFKTNKPPKMNHLQGKNNSAKSGILVSLN
jgi:hypothetical protein